jgi:hypothetical protein
MPHLSLIYGDVPEPTKALLKPGLVERTRGRYACTRLELWLTVGPHEEWHVVKAVDLKSP